MKLQSAIAVALVFGTITSNAVAEDGLQSLRREFDELKTRVTALEEENAKLKQQIDQQMAMMGQFSAMMPPEAKEVLDSLSISQSGRTIRASVEISQTLIDQAMSGQMGRPSGGFPQRRGFPRGQ